jgi:hypothetical protein
MAWRSAWLSGCTEPLGRSSSSKGNRWGLAMEASFLMVLAGGPLGTSSATLLVRSRLDGGLPGPLGVAAVVGALLGVNPLDGGADLLSVGPLKGVARVGAEGPVRIGDLVGAPVVFDLSGGLSPRPPAPGRLGNRAERFQHIARAIGFDCHSGGPSLPGDGSHHLPILRTQVGVDLQPPIPALLVLAQLPLAIMNPVDQLGGQRHSTRHPGRLVAVAAQPAKHAAGLVAGGLLVGGQSFLGVLAVGGGLGQLAATVAGRLVELAAQPVPLGPQLGRRQPLEIVGGGGVDGQGLPASPRQGLGQLQVAVGLLAVGQVQLSSTLRFWSDDGVQAGVLPGPRQLHIQPVDILGAGEPDQGSAPGQPLGPVAGGGVGQVDPAVALATAAAVEIRPGKRDIPAVVTVQAQGQATVVGVEGGDGAAAAVGHPELGDGVLPADGPVPHRQLAVLDLEPLASEAATGGQQLLTDGVEPVHLGPAGGQHHHILSRILLSRLPGPPPVLEQGQGGGRLGVGSHYPVVSLVGGYRLLDQPAPDEIEGFAFPGLVLAAVLDQLGGAEAEAEGAEAAASVDRGQLPVITDQHHLGLGVVGVLEGAGELAAAEHAGLIDYQHRAGVQLLAAALKVAQQPVASGHLLEPLALQAQGGNPGRGTGQEPIAVQLPGMAGDAKGEVLPVPARPTTRATPWPPWHRSRTIAC